MNQTWTQIEMRYERALSQANTLESLARKLKTHARHVSEICRSVSEVWSGVHADAWLRKAMPVSRTIGQSADALSREAATLRKKAVAVRNAERAALLAAQTRTS